MGVIKEHMINDFLVSHSKQPTLPIGDRAHWGNQTPLVEKRNATASQPMTDLEFKVAIERLKTKLSSEQSFRHDVPRGYYLNVRI